MLFREITDIYYDVNVAGSKRKAFNILWVQNTAARYIDSMQRTLKNE